LNEKVSQAELKSALHAVFSPFGKVLRIICARTYKLRGQAWVVYKQKTDAISAVSNLDGFKFYDKPLSLTYAQKQSSLQESGSKENTAHGKYAGRKADSQAKERATRARGDSLSNHTSLGNIGNVDAHRSALLCVRGLPASTTETMLKLLFEQFAGFKSVMLQDNSVGTALVQFRLADHAAVALNGLQGFKLNPTHTLSLSYSRGSQID
jgi:U2 small nuclear ribonucleoprotein B''